MDPRPLYLVLCESEINQVSLVQYVRADSPENAMVFAREPGVRPVKAERFDEASDWMLDAVNRNARAVAGVHDAVRTLSASSIIKHPHTTIFWAAFCAVIASVLFGILLQVFTHLR